MNFISKTSSCCDDEGDSATDGCCSNQDGFVQNNSAFVNKSIAFSNQFNLLSIAYVPVILQISVNDHPVISGFYRRSQSPPGETTAALIASISVLRI